MGKTIARILAAAISVLATDAVAEPSSFDRIQPREWARPIDAVGIPNFHQVATNFYRSAQPNAQGFRTIATQYGVRTVISLRAFNADEPLASGLNLHLVRYKIHTWHIERDDVVGALSR